MIDALPLDLLGRHVGESPEDGSRRGLTGQGREVGSGSADLIRSLLCEAEVEDLRPALAGDEDVLRLQVAVDDPLVVGGGEAFADPDRELEDAAGSERPAREARPQRVSLEELEDHVGRAVVDPGIEDREQVRIVEGARQPRLLLEAAQAFRVGRDFGAQHLQRDLAPETVVPRSIHLPHSTGTEWSDHFIGAEPGARGECHVHSGEWQ